MPTSRAPKAKPPTPELGTRKRKGRATEPIKVPPLEEGDERKRVLNVLAQRRYREKRKARIEELEAKLAERGEGTSSIVGQTAVPTSTSAKPGPGVEKLHLNGDENVGVRMQVLSNLEVDLSLTPELNDGRGYVTFPEVSTETRHAVAPQPTDPMAIGSAFMHTGGQSGALIMPMPSPRAEMSSGSTPFFFDPSVILSPFDGPWTGAEPEKYTDTTQTNTTSSSPPSPSSPSSPSSPPPRPPPRPSSSSLPPSPPRPHRSTSSPSTLTFQGPPVTTFPDEAHLQINTLRVLYAAQHIASILNVSDLIWSLDSVSPFTIIPSWPLPFSSPTCQYLHLPSNLRPTRAQQLYIHHPLIDLLPWPKVRDRLILILSTPSHLRPPSAASPTAFLDFAFDFEDEEEGARVSGDDPYCEDSWEVGKKLYQNWWWLFDPAIIRRSDMLRRARGAGSLLDKPAG